MPEDPPSCIFCGGDGGSREHAWPAWLRRYLVPLAAGADADERKRLDTEADFTVDCVCDRCNRGWMRKLENLVNPNLKKMMVGESCTLSGRDVFALRRWAIKTSAVFEGFSGNFHASERLRRSLQRGQSPPHAAVLIGRYSGRHLLTHTRAVFAPVDDLDRHVTWVTLVLGQVLIVVFSDFDLMKPTATLTSRARRNFVELPAGTGVEIRWPPAEPIDDRLLSAIERGPNKELRDASPPPSVHL